MRQVTCVLHHHIGPETPFEAGLSVSSIRGAYEAQIEWILRRFNIVSLEQMLVGDMPRRPLLLTFDDAFRSVLDVAEQVLAPRNLPSVFFVNPELVGFQTISLDGAIAGAASLHGVREVCRALNLPMRDHVRDVISKDMSKLGSAERAAVRTKIVETFDLLNAYPRSETLLEQDIERLSELGVEIGNHTSSHVHCRSLSRDERLVEIGGAKQRLEELSGRSVRAFSVPYGHEADLPPDVLDIVRETGHEAIFLVHARSNRWRPARDIWYRSSLQNEHPRNMAMKIVIKPFLRSLRHQFLRSAR